MTHKWGRMATYPKLGDSQLSNRDERPHGETPHLMRVHVPSPNRPYPWSSGARNLGGEIRGRRSLWPFWANGVQPLVICYNIRPSYVPHGDMVIPIWHTMAKTAKFGQSGPHS